MEKHEVENLLLKNNTTVENSIRESLTRDYILVTKGKLWNFVGGICGVLIAVFGISYVTIQTIVPEGIVNHIKQLERQAIQGVERIESSERMLTIVSRVQGDSSNPTAVLEFDGLPDGISLVVATSWNTKDGRGYRSYATWLVDKRNNEKRVVVELGNGAEPGHANVGQKDSKFYANGHGSARGEILVYRLPTK